MQLPNRRDGLLLMLAACAALALPVAGMPREPVATTTQRFANSGPGTVAETAVQTRSEILDTVRELVAGYFGIPLADVTGDTDLILDLYADPMDVAEVLAIVCERFDLESPPRSDLRSVRAIVEYLTRAISQRAKPPSREGKLRRFPKSVEKKPAAAPIYVQHVFYATDRKPTGRSRPHEHYGGQRASDHQLSYGICEVTIPVSVHKKGREERPSFIKLQWREDPKKHIVLRAIRPLPRQDFVRALNSRLTSSTEAGGRDALIYIHGFNTTFANAARRTAQMTYDLAFPGVPILFSWPSDGRGRAYFSDREDVEWSAPHFEKFVRGLLAGTHAERLHLIAHSMGSQVLIRTLYAIALQRADDHTPLFENVILAAPDFDAQAFTEQLGPRILSLAKRWTLYASDRDIALKASTTLTARRLGLPLPVMEGMDTVDASGIDVTPWSAPEFHAYHASKQRVIADLVNVLKGRSPSERNLPRRTKGGLPYWILPPLR